MDILIVKVVLVMVALIATFYDIKEKRIPNALTFPAILMGIVLNTIFNGFEGLVFSIAGFFTGMVLFFIPFASGAMGAGDVKLMGAIGSLMGWRFVVVATLFSAISGLLVVFVYLIYQKKLFCFLKKYFLFFTIPIMQALSLSFKSEKLDQIHKNLLLEKHQIHDEKLYVPYGVAIALGALFTLSGIYKDFLSF
ncbi:prepilin peptidase CpaA [Alkalibaculum bacchi]|uniref:Prepilin peptidase CpaA n=1 Tax=Alkalibaculum bacchi TaxID=645887 RepID=A0A366I9H9_9FIRM|nr:A24 family peptidase [Alkalibaculum bacchi]RBP66001.1 prepilin peptidase CpaA [Alkalibaculum bacchi]